MMEESLELEADPTAMDPKKVADMLRMMAEQIAQLQQMFPADAGAEVADEVDEGTAEGEAEEAAEPASEETAPVAGDEKAASKSRAAMLLARTLGKR